jgi:prepilin-type N-terminal cleavage/methylation domain-containing protein
MKRARQEEGYTLMELLVVVTILGFVMGALTIAWFTGLRGTSQAASAIEGPRNSNALAFWLASDIASATPVNLATWLDETAAASSGCLTTPAGSTNLLRVETRNPKVVLASAERYVASYRYVAAERRVVRTFCRQGEAALVSATIAEDVTTAAGSVAADKRSATLTLSIQKKTEPAYTVSQTAAIRVPETAPVVVSDTTPTIPTKPPCAYSAPTALPGSVARIPGPGNNPRTLSQAVTISVTDNSAAGGACTGLVAIANSISCTLARSGATWSAECFVGDTSWRFSPKVYSVSVVDFDPGDAAAVPPEPATTTAISGPPFSFTVT